MRRTLHAAVIVLATSVLGPACLLNAGPYESAGEGGTTTTTTSTTATGGSTGGGGATGGATGGGGAMGPFCGDMMKDADEECDMGAANSDDGDCTSHCKMASCGDGLVHTQGAGELEDCDEGMDNSDTGDCTLACKSATCGDELVWKDHEDCDDGNTVETDGCTNDCTTICGDGLVIGVEECEDGNKADDDGCSASCKLESDCGNGRVDPEEVCDTGTGCSADCKTIDVGTACGKAVPLTPGAPDASGIRNTHVEGDTNDMQTPNGELLNPSCADPHKARLFTYKTGNKGSIVFAATVSMTLGGEATFDDTTLWAYRDCVGKRAEEACSDDIAPPGNKYSQIQTGYLPPETTLFLVVGGHGDPNVGKFSLDIIEQPVRLLFGTTFDTDLASMTVNDVGADGSWIWCDGIGGCGGNSTKSWSGRGFATISDATDKNHAGENLTSASVNTLGLNTVYVQYAFDFSQKGGNPVEAYTFLHSTDNASYTLVTSDTMNTGGIRERFDVSGAAKSTTTYSVQVRYDDLGGQGAFIKVDDLYIYGY